MIIFAINMTCSKIIRSTRSTGEEMKEDVYNK